MLRFSFGSGLAGVWGGFWLASEVVMHPARNFNPEWGYLAPAPNFMHTLRIAVVAAAVGATGGAAVVFSLIDRPGADKSVAARTMAAGSPSALVAVRAQKLPPELPTVASQAAGPLASELGAVTTMQRPVIGAALAELPTVQDMPQANPFTAQRRLATPQPVWNARVNAPLRPADRGPVALLRTLGAPTSASPPHGDY